MFVYQFGTFDVANYGDLLFPLLACRRLSAIGADIVAVSPIGSKPVFSDCLSSVGIDRIRFQKPAVVLIGGGNIAAIAPTRLPDYCRGTSFISGYPDLWVGASCLADTGIPVCWNAPGVPVPFDKATIPVVNDCLKRSAYLSVRDRQSRDYLLQACPDAVIEIVPDSAWEIGALWTIDELKDAYEKAFVSRNRKPPSRSIVVHVNQRYMAGNSVTQLAGIFDEISRSMDAIIILTAIGPCHDDDKLARQIGTEMKSNPLIIDQPQSLVEIAACIANSVAYAGSSMHGLITASAFGIPGVCVATSSNKKFDELKIQLDGEDVMITSWHTVAEKLMIIDTQDYRKKLNGITEKMCVRLNKHWETILQIARAAAKSGDNALDAQSCALNQSIMFLKYRNDLLLAQTARHIQFYDETLVKLSHAKRIIVERDKAIELANRQVVLEISYQNELYKVYVSRSWRYTALFRKVGGFFRRSSNLLYFRFVRKIMKAGYHCLPDFIRCGTLIQKIKTCCR